MSEMRSERRKMKEMMVFELYNKGMTSRKIASLVHLSLRDVIKYIHRISDKTKSPSTVSVMDEVVLEYRVSGLRREVKDLQIERANLINEVKDLREQKFNLQIQLRAKQSELDVVKRDLGYEILRNIFND
jgi:hypothetical protein